MLVTGCEAHICVLQTVIGLTEMGYRAVLVSDAAGSRKPSDHHAALRRARAHGADIVTTEMAIFEWMETCEHRAFATCYVWSNSGPGCNIVPRERKDYLVV